MKKINFKLTVILIIAALFAAACAEQNSSQENEYSITEVSAAGIGETTRLIFTFNEEIPDLCADDIKINKDASLSLIKGDLIKTGLKTYELGLIPGRTDTIKVGLDPYRGFTGWSAKSVRVTADFYFNGTTNLTITGYGLTIKENKIDIPGIIGGISVIAIGDGAFQLRSLKDIFIPDTITNIGNSAFYNNNLENLDDVIPDSVTRIGSNAFAGNQIKSFKIPVNLESIGSGAFANNKIAKLEYFEEEAKDGETPRPNTKLVHLSGFNNNVLEKITIPLTVTEIGENAFAYNQINQIETWVWVIDEENKKYSTNITTYNDGAFMYNQLKGIRFFEGTTTIGRNTFSNNQIENVTFGSNITTIGSGAFAYNKIETITIPDAVTSIGGSAFAYNQIKTITIPGQITAINEGTFRNNQLTEVVFSKSVKSIGNEAFRNNLLEKIDIPPNVTSIGNEAFRNNRLTEITIGEKVMLGIETFGDGFENAYIKHERAAGTYTRNNANSTEWKLEEEGEDNKEPPGNSEEEDEIETGMQSKSLFTSMKIML